MYRACFFALRKRVYSFLSRFPAKMTFGKLPPSFVSTVTEVIPARLHRPTKHPFNVYSAPHSRSCALHGRFFILRFATLRQTETTHLHYRDQSQTNIPSRFRRHTNARRNQACHDHNHCAATGSASIRAPPDRLV